MPEVFKYLIIAQHFKDSRMEIKFFLKGFDWGSFDGVLGDFS